MNRKARSKWARGALQLGSWLATPALIASLQAAPLGTAFTYQGLLQQAGVPFTNGLGDFQFSLWDAATGGTQVGATQTVGSVAISNGLFTVAVDFGSSAFDGNARWLQLGLRIPAGAGNYTLLSPRQPLKPAPYALNASSVAAGVVTSGALASGAVVAGKLGPGAVGLATDVSGILPVANGGTGAGTAPGALATLGAASLSGPNNFSAANTLANPGNLFVGTFTGSGAGLTNLSGVIKWQPVNGTIQTAISNQGYLATNPALVTITLPAVPALGDVVRVSGVGAGGWKIAQNAGQWVLAKGLGGLAGRIWLNRNVANNWQCLASSSDGSRLLAGTAGNQLYTSADSGATWTSHENSRSWTGVASSADGARLAAVANAGHVYVSADFGTTWTARVSQQAWSGLASSSDGSRLIAVANGAQIYTSADFGQTWTAHEIARPWQAVASSADGIRLVAVVNSGLLYTSSDAGTSWIGHDSARAWLTVASSADGAKLVAAVNGGQLYTSTDFGASWFPRDSTRAWQSVASSADGIRLVAAVNGGSGQVFTSTDSGLTWVARTSLPNAQCVASSVDGTKLVAGAGTGGSVYTSTATTTLGAAGFLLGDADAAIELQFIGNNQFRSLSHEGTITAY